jgi:inhibitor of KinA sporulation pathway (predicted exonuclease)
MIDTSTAQPRPRASSRPDFDWRTWLVLDLEATCWPDRPPPGERIEVIEIGVCAYHLDSRVIEPPVSILVRPDVSRVSAFCTELTSLTQEMVDAGVPFAAACHSLRALGSERCVWASWGQFDRTLLLHECALRGLPYPMADRHVNLKKLFAREMNKRQRAGLGEALALAGIEPAGRAHRGVDDAHNTARLLDALVAAKGGEAVLRYARPHH